MDLNGDLTMGTLLEHYPGARRALFSAFHIGGCQSCSYELTDTLASVCKKNEIDMNDALACLVKSHAHDLEMLLSPSELKDLMNSDEAFTFLDTRTREEFEATSIKGAEFMTQERQTEIFADKNQDQKIILIDHQGRNVLDHCAWFRGHGLKNTFGIDGGIDRYAREIDHTIPRYRLELD
ncbi:rhodanese-like domain-containing protein [Akkermansiaceae bacterium]|nr:rhodanese-like domain-containing protein [Akkermansiaceae bacterium]MDA7888731.1 rhodanese-like domain-containing protein [Akkermansiaceae bacterium]MDB4537544.1 rhodanese-like domain-containing protein [Akkermansiaceae bacterium]